MINTKVIKISKIHPCTPEEKGEGWGGKRTSRTTWYLNRQNNECKRDLPKNC